MKKTVLIVLFAFGLINVFGQEEDKKTENVKTGFSMGAIPVIAYNSDEGLKYGALANIYLYGDGSRYPKYDHSIYMEWSRTTKGGGVNRITYDSDRLIPNIRTTADIAFLTEKALDFYGFNGYKSLYNPNFADSTSDEYISSLYYRLERKQLRLQFDFQGDIIEQKLRWLAGFAYYGIDIASIDRENYTDEPTLIPTGTQLLYDKYVNWGVIPENQALGGDVSFFKFGAVFDTRDNEPNPNKGMWSEALFLVAPSFIGNDDNFTKIMLSHRQYFTLVPNRLTFAYRASYQAKLSGTMPFYMQSFEFNSKSTNEGLGGSKNLRGILRNRIIGDGYTFANAEFRWKALNTKVFGQNFYIGLSSFLDAGRIIDPFNMDLSGVPNNELANFYVDDENWHLTLGAGIRFALNDNFIIAVDYGTALDERDGTSGLYIGLNWLF